VLPAEADGRRRVRERGRGFAAGAAELATLVRPRGRGGARAAGFGVFGASGLSRDGQAGLMQSVQGGRPASTAVTMGARQVGQGA
jgi:hypothetical protein